MTLGIQLLQNTRQLCQDVVRVKDRIIVGVDDLLGRAARELSRLTNRRELFGSRRVAGREKHLPAWHALRDRA